MNSGRRFVLRALAAALAKRDCAVIVLASTVGAIAANKIATRVPIVFVGVADPIGAGVVQSLAHPGGTMTGLSRGFGAGLIGKALQDLKEVVPTASHTGILWNAGSDVASPFDEADAAVRALGMTPHAFPIRGVGELPDAFARMRRERIDALVVVTDPLTLRYREDIVNLCANHRIPAMYEFAEFAQAGGLMAYAADIPALFARAAVYVDKILHGASPGDLPVEQPTKFRLVVNLRTATALGLVVPQSVLLRADEVIG